MPFPLTLPTIAAMEIDFWLTFYAIAAFVAISILLAGMILYTKAALVSRALCKISINDNPELSKEV